MSSHVAGKPPRATSPERLVRNVTPDVMNARQPSIEGRGSAMGKDGEPRRLEKIARVDAPGGAFLFGEEPVEVEVGAFSIGLDPVTNAQYAPFVRATRREAPKHWKGAEPPEEAVSHPVVYVSWFDAIEFAEWVGGRLPTEVE
jgi:formylglycine-generating enzyme required for sulfatase activity